MKVRIEMDLPDGLDPSTLLEKMGEIALELHEEYGDDEDMSDDARERIVGAVSVEVRS